MTTPDGNRIIKGFQTMFFTLLNLSGLFLIANTMFVVPMFIERKNAWLKVLEKTDPAQFQKVSTLSLFKALDWLSAPADFLFSWWFIALPVFFGLLQLFVITFGKRVTPGTRLLILAFTSLGVSVLTMAHSTVAGIAGAILIANWKP